MRLGVTVVVYRALRRAERSLTRIADALERLADASEGYPRPRSAPPVLDPPLEVVRSSPGEFERAYVVEQRLRRTLGRDPDPDDIARELDGLRHDEPAAPDADPVPGRRTATGAGRWP